MLKIIVLKGLPASGKTTWAREFLKDKGKEWIRVNRDDIRRMLGDYWVPQREKLVTAIERGCILAALQNKFNVIIDATNLNPKFNRELVDLIFNHSQGKYAIEDKHFDIDVEECVKRDKLRPGTECVGEKVIRDMYSKYFAAQDEGNTYDRPI